MSRLRPTTPRTSRAHVVILENLVGSMDAGDSEHPGVVINRFRLAGHLCDATLRTTDGGVFLVHRLMMCTLSPFFAVLYTSSLARGTDVLLHGVSAHVLDKLIEFCYTHKVEINDNNVEELLVAADMFLVEDLMQMCCAHLEEQLTISNCLGLLLHAEWFYYPSHKEKIMQFVCEHFIEVIFQSEELMYMSYEFLYSLLSSDYLNVVDESTVLMAIIKWVEFNTEDRVRFAPHLFLCVRIGLCNPEPVEKVVSLHPWMAQFEDCRNALLRLTESQPWRWRPRAPNEVIFTVGGWAETRATSVMEIYDNRADRWHICVDDDIAPRAYHGLVVLKGLVYMIGGFDGELCFNTVQCYDPQKHVWEERSCMNMPRCYVSAAAVGGYIYAAGGFTGQTRTNSVEKYHPLMNQWYAVTAMHKRRSDACACGFNGKLYVAGGFTGTRVLNSVEMYDPTIDTWVYIEPMLSSRSGFRLLQFADTIYAIGGFDGALRLCTVERYNRLMNQWERAGCMRLGRSNFAAAVLEGSIYVMGGFNGTTTISDVERLDNETLTWIPSTPLGISRSAFSACVLKNSATCNRFAYCRILEKLESISN
ncbi:kelch-like protein 10 [Ornithodoros turicata]|uniref:kelch-like protein 10 n=1 Tax=Ornithodoros turicata TaxID=34597 RepID=UPI003138FB65